MDTMDTTLLLTIIAGTLFGGFVITRVLNMIRRLSRRVVYIIAALTATGGGGVASEWSGLTNITSLFGG